MLATPSQGCGSVSFLRIMTNIHPSKLDGRGYFDGGTCSKMRVIDQSCGKVMVIGQRFGNWWNFTISWPPLSTNVTLLHTLMCSIGDRRKKPAVHKSKTFSEFLESYFYLNRMMVPSPYPPSPPRLLLFIHLISGSLFACGPVAAAAAVCVATNREQAGETHHDRQITMLQHHSN